MSTVSAEYRELLPSEVEAVAQRCADAWKSADIPARQLEIVKPELEKYRLGGACAPFDTLIRCMKQLPDEMKWPATSILDIGASGGYYREILRHNSFWCEYSAFDFSPAFKKLAEELYHDINFIVGDARKLEFKDDSFDIILNAAVLMHTLEFEKVIAESARVASKYVIFHRTPILTTRPTTYFEKLAYDVPCLEIHFNEAELLEMFDAHGLSVVWTDEVFFDFSKSFGHRDYVCRKEPIIHHRV